MTTYLEKLKDPRWQKKRLKILERDGFTCQACLDENSTLHVHHRLYLKGNAPWDYPDELLTTLCEGCHDGENESRIRYEKSLLLALKKHLFSEQVDHLASYFSNAKFYNHPTLVVDFIGWVLCDEKVQNEVVGKYLEFLKSHGEG